MSHDKHVIDGYNQDVGYRSWEEARDYYLELASDWTDPNPDPVVTIHDGVRCVRDDLIAGTANVEITGNATTTGDLYVGGKITAVGGVDPPYVSYSDESCNSIRAMYKRDAVKDNVMQFWNASERRFDYYLADEDKCYPMGGEAKENWFISIINLMKI